MQVYLPCLRNNETLRRKDCDSESEEPGVPFSSEALRTTPLLPSELPTRTTPGLSLLVSGLGRPVPSRPEPHGWCESTGSRSPHDLSPVWVGFRVREVHNHWVFYRGSMVKYRMPTTHYFDQQHPVFFFFLHPTRGAGILTTGIGFPFISLSLRADVSLTALPFPSLAP